MPSQADSRSGVALGAVLAASLLACSDAEPALTRAELMDPESCRGCHPTQYADWAGSMHAYAAEDPVFRAMNARGQRETGGALGDFCVRCHAPMAVREGRTTDGLNIAEVPPAMRGVTCYFCHQVTDVLGDHNNPLVLADDDVMRGGIANPVSNPAHRSAYSPLHDRTEVGSSSMCGSCHDITLNNGVELERTYQEWRGTLYSRDTPGEGQSCSRCHMQGQNARAADYPGAPGRRTALHMWAGVDVALTPFPDMERQRARVQRKLDTTLFATLCVRRVPGGLEIDVDLENLAAGHSWPSGAAHDRRAWVELQASLAGRPVLTSGRLPEGRPLVDLEAEDPNLWRIGDFARKADGDEAHMFWEIVDVESELLPGATATSTTDPRYRDPHVIRTYRLDGTIADRIEMKVHIRPVGLDIIDDLVATGDLDPVIRDRMPTFTLASSRIVWTADQGEGCFTQ